MVPVGPGRFLRTLASAYDPRSHGDVKLHFNAFGGFSDTVEWIESGTYDITREFAAEPTRAGAVCPGGPGLLAGRTVA